MKKIITFLLSVALIMNYVTFAANDYFYSENEQQSSNTVRSESELCNFRFVLENPYGTGWSPSVGIEITVDGVNYGFLNLPWGVGNYSIEEIIALPSGELQLYWIGTHNYMIHQFEVYNSLDELIYASPENDFINENPFFTYQNECIECLPLTDFEGEYNSETKQVNLSWIVPDSEDLTGFDIYRNDELLEHVSSSTVSYSDNTSELEEGDYKYCVVPVYPSICTLDEKCFETYISNVGVINYKNNITIYPNPATDFINLSGDGVLEARMYNSIGQLVLNQYNTNTINVSELTNGIYILSIKTLSDSIIQTKIIINHY